MSHSEVTSKTSSYQEVCFLTNWQTRFARLQVLFKNSNLYEYYSDIGCLYTRLLSKT